MIIDGQEIRLGESAQIDLFVAALPTRTPVTIRTYIFRAKEEGPTLLLTGGIHGDELNGIEILRRMIFEKQFHPEFGTIVVIPIMNQFAFLEKKRELPDGRDLNRSFPGSAKGPLAKQLANVVSSKILPFIDYGIDFHTGSGGRTNFPQLRFDSKSISDRTLVEMFGPTFALNSPARAESYRFYANKIGKSIVTYEAGEALRFDDDSINEGILGTLSVMDKLGIQRSALNATPKKTIFFETSSWIRATHAGLFRSLVNNGAKVEKNQIIAIISDPFGDVSFKIKASKSGFIIGMNNKPIVYKGDALYHIGLN